MADFIFKISPNIVLGSYVTSRLGQFAAEYGTKFILILDPILKEVGISEKITQALQDRNIEYFVYDEIPTDANSEVLADVLSIARDARIHGVIAAGGGRTLALAKAVCALFYENHDLYDFMDGASPSTAPLPFICIPTTVRDTFLFSERTPIIDARSSRLKLIKTQSALCKLILWDPAHTVSLTEKQISSMSIEILAIAIEAYMSQKSTFFSDMLIEKGLQLLSFATDGSPTLTVTTPQEVLLTQAGCMASLASATSSLGVCSLLSMAINGRFRISRFLISVILLPYIIEDGAKFQASRLARIAKILRVCPEDVEDSNAVIMLAEYVRQKIAKVNIPSRLKELSLSIEQLTRAVEDCGDLDIINHLPRSMTTDDLFEIIKQAY